MTQGSISSLDGDVVEVAGLDGIAAGARVALGQDGVGIVKGLHGDSVRVALLDRGRRLVPGARVAPVGPLVVPVGPALRGRVVDPLGRPLDGAAAGLPSPVRPLPVRSPGLRSRAPMSRPLVTGIKAVDILHPLRCGAAAAFVGPRGVGKTDLLLTATIANRGRPCFLCLVGTDPAQLAQLVAVLRRTGALAHTTVIAVYASAPPAMLVLAPFSAMAMAEYERVQGGDAMVAIDGYGQHADAFRGMMAGLRAVPPSWILQAEVFSMQAALLDPVGQLDAGHGGGALSVLVAVEAADPIPLAPMNIQYLVDRVYRLDAQRFHSGQRPAIVPPPLVSKLASDCARPLQRLAGSIRLSIAQSEELRAFAALRLELDQTTQQTLARGERDLHLLRQPAAAPVRLELQVTLAVAAGAGFLAGLALDRLAAFERELDGALLAAAVTIPLDRALDPEMKKNLQDLASSVAQRVKLQ